MAKRVIEPMAEEHVNVTPLIDVVMCLIIFFLVCGKLAKDELEGGQVNVPVAQLGQEIQEQRDRLVINVVPDQSAMDNPQVKGLPEKEQKRILGATIPKIYVRGQQIDRDRLTGILREEKQKNKDLKIMVRADEVQHYQYVAPVLVSCAQANILTVHFTTKGAN